MMNVRDIIKRAGGQTLVANICGMSKQGVQSWINKDSLPATEWTGRTHYASLVSQQAALLGHEITPLDICPGAGQYMSQSNEEAA